MTPSYNISENENPLEFMVVEKKKKVSISYVLRMKSWSVIVKLGFGTNPKQVAPSVSYFVNFS